MDPASLAAFAPLGTAALGWWMKMKAEERLDLKEEREAYRRSRQDDTASADAAVKRVPFDVGATMRWALILIVLTYRYGGALLAMILGYPVVKENIVHVPSFFFNLIPARDELVYVSIYGFPLTYEDGITLLSITTFLLGSSLAGSSRRI